MEIVLKRLDPRQELENIVAETADNWLRLKKSLIQCQGYRMNLRMGEKRRHVLIEFSGEWSVSSIELGRYHRKT